MKYRTPFIIINNENVSLNWFSKYVVNTNDLLVNMDCFCPLKTDHAFSRFRWSSFIISTNYLNSDILILTFKGKLIFIWHDLFAQNSVSMRLHCAKIVCSIRHTFMFPTSVVYNFQQFELWYNHVFPVIFGAVVAVIA